MSDTKLMVGVHDYSFKGEVRREVIMLRMMEVRSSLLSILVKQERKTESLGRGEGEITA